MGMATLPLWSAWNMMPFAKGRMPARARWKSKSSYAGRNEILCSTRYSCANIFTYFRSKNLESGGVLRRSQSQVANDYKRWEWRGDTRRDNNRDRMPSAGWKSTFATLFADWRVLKWNSVMPISSWFLICLYMAQTVFTPLWNEMPSFHKALACSLREILLSEEATPSSEIGHCGTH